MFSPAIWKTASRVSKIRPLTPITTDLHQVSLCALSPLSPTLEITERRLGVSIELEGQSSAALLVSQAASLQSNLHPSHFIIIRVSSTKMVTEATSTVRWALVPLLPVV
jgi:hypothetical protein